MDGCMFDLYQLPLMLKLWQRQHWAMVLARSIEHLIFEQFGTTSDMKGCSFSKHVF